MDDQVSPLDHAVNGGKMLVQINGNREPDLLEKRGDPSRAVEGGSIQVLTHGFADDLVDSLVAMFS
jgi:hypothetical protein